MQCDCHKNRSAASHENTCDAQREAKRKFVAKIEMLWLEGYSTYEIAAMTDEMPRIVGRNLREIRKRQRRAAQRQSETMVASQLAAIQQEALEGWRRSQKPKVVTSTRRQIDEDTVQTTHITEGPANPAFLNTALRAVKEVKQLVAAKPSQAELDRQALKLEEDVHAALLKVLTPEQAATLSQEQLETLREATGRRAKPQAVAQDETFGVSTGEYGNDAPPAAEVIQMADAVGAEVAIDRSNHHNTVELAANVTPSRVPSDSQDPSVESPLIQSCLAADCRSSQESGENAAENGHFLENGEWTPSDRPAAVGRADEGPECQAMLELAAAG